MKYLTASLFNRYTLAAQLVHWILFSIALYQRGGITRLFKDLHYEPIIMQVLMRLDLPALYVIDLIFPASYLSYSAQSNLIIFVAIITIQWLLVGAVIHAALNLMRRP